jgi:catalase (peroxidase I)
VTHPTKWTNQYFRSLLRWDWEVYVGPGGHHQWRPQHKPSESAAEKKEPLPDIMSESGLPGFFHDRVPGFGVC